MAVSLALRNKLLQAYFTPDTYVADSTLYVAVTNAVGEVNAPGANLNEPAASAYARCAVPLSSDYWDLSGYGELFNIVDIDFPPPVAGEDWGYLGGWAVVDAPDGGMTQAVGALVLPMQFTSDLPLLSLPPHAITIGLYDQS